MFKIFKLIVVVLTTVFLMELSTRFFYDRPWVNGYSYNRYTGTTLTPGTKGWWNREGRGFVEINSAGMRDNREYELEPESDTFRIAVVGDSYVEAVQVNVDETFWRLLEQKLNHECTKQSSIRYEVLPFGVSGHGPAQYLKNVKHNVLKYKPNLIIVLFTPGNDFRNSIEAIENDPSKPYLIENPIDPSNFLWDMSFRQEPYADTEVTRSTINNFLDKLNLIALTKEIKMRVEAKKNEKLKVQVENLAEIEATKNLGDNYMFLEYKKIPEDWQRARRVVSALIAKFGELQDKEVKIMGVIGTSGVQVHPNKELRRSFAERIGVNNLSEPSRYFSEAFKVAGIESVDLLAKISNKALKTGYGMHGIAPDWGGHWNRNGHVEVAKVLGERICATNIFENSVTN